MQQWQDSYLERYYRSKPRWFDGTTEFHLLCQKYIQSDWSILELGAGPSNQTSKWLSAISGKLLGLDIDPAVKENKFLAEAYVADARHIPLAESSVEAVVSNYVNEHLGDPTSVCKEIHRILVQGGYFIFRTPNIFHYVALAGKLAPFSLTKIIANPLRSLPEEAHDPYPTFYRFNSKQRCQSLLRKTGFEIIEMYMVEKEPSYGMYSRLLFIPMMWYERMVNSAEIFNGLRANIFCVAQKAGPIHE